MQFDQLGRREFITLLAGAAALRPLAAHAQQVERTRRVGVFTAAFAADDPEGQARVGAFLQGLQQRGWSIGRNLRIEYRWGAGDAERTRKYAAELAALAPDVILTSGAATIGPLLQVTRSAALASEASGQRGDSKVRAPDTRPEPGSSARAVPIVFVNVSDPVGAGFVDSLARPGGNATGFIQFEYGLSGKWLELLKQIAPSVTRAAVIRDPAISAGIGQWGALQTAAPSLGVELTAVNVRDTGELERAFAGFARSPNGGLIVTGSAAAAFHRNLIVTLAARHSLPAVYYARHFVSGGGLISYAPDIIDQYRQAATYVDRILKGEKPADLPVQAPTRYELVINLKTAKALGLEVPATLLARADEVVE